MTLLFNTTAKAVSDLSRHAPPRGPLPHEASRCYGRKWILAAAGLLLAHASAPSSAWAGQRNTGTGDLALFNNTGSDNTADGYEALYSNTDGILNTAVGSEALLQNKTGNQNTAAGYSALSWNTTGNYNTAAGSYALNFNTTGSNNTAAGAGALYHNSTGSFNTADGVGALDSNTTGSYNTATGFSALRENKTGELNTAIGVDALGANVDGTRNTASGSAALAHNTSGSYNTATGRGSLAANTVGSYNHAYGAQALAANISGDNNAAYSDHALGGNTTGGNNTAAGSYALSGNTTGNNNIALGAHAGENLTTGSNNIAIGTAGIAGESNTIRIGKPQTQKKTFIQGIFGAPVAGGVQVMANSGGKLGTVASSARFKEQIKPMEDASEALLALKPVTFRYKEEYDADKIPQFGLVAEEVEKVNPDLVARDENGKVFTVRYEAVNAMLLNEFLKEHRKNEEQQKAIDSLAALVKRQAAQIEQVSGRLDVGSSAPQVAGKQKK